MSKTCQLSIDGSPGTIVREWRLAVCHSFIANLKNPVFLHLAFLIIAQPLLRVRLIKFQCTRHTFQHWFVSIPSAMDHVEVLGDDFMLERLRTGRNLVTY